ncbi:MAG: hypothetical protein WA056_03080 [Gallionella sp.]
MDSQTRLSHLISEYNNAAEKYKEYVDHLVATLGTLLFAGEIKCHAIVGRLKTRESLRGKIINGRKEYASLEEITDIAGVRITTYFSSDVDKVANLIAPMFLIDEKNSIDRRQTIDSDRFGYLSLHYIVRPNPTIDSDSQFDHLPAEIQVRSILQHAWAEIEHDLGYKVPSGIPRTIRRKFSLAAGLLELADHQFDEIRLEVDEYRKDLPTAIHKQANVVAINVHSLHHLIEHDAPISALDLRISRLVGGSLSGTFSVSRLLKMLQIIDINTVGDLLENIGREQTKIIAFTTEWFANSNSADVVALNKGISILFLFYTKISAGLDASRVIASLHDAGVSDRLVSETSRRVLEAAKGLDVSH